MSMWRSLEVSSNSRSLELNSQNRPLLPSQPLLELSEPRLPNAREDGACPDGSSPPKGQAKGALLTLSASPLLLRADGRAGDRQRGCLWPRNGGPYLGPPAPRPILPNGRDSGGRGGGRRGDCSGGYSICHLLRARGAFWEGAACVRRTLLAEEHTFSHASIWPKKA